ncbi:hypothetical protein [Helicobacter heilmannii]|uniref:hypothetical protein n=1 Tax=Helicobacter heilmannii TaxID=35817 RepID=UPI0012E19A69|nr:hypothetical protein [Helicobacter heilmannii]
MRMGILLNLLIVVFLTLTGVNLYVAYVLQYHSQVIDRMVKEIRALRSSMENMHAKPR